MAQTKKKTSSGKKAPSKSSSSKKKADEAVLAPDEAIPPIRRELAAVIFLFLAVFEIISYFNTDGTFVSGLAEFMKGMVGWGFWFTVPAFLLVSLILGFHQGKPVAFRVFCALLVPVFISAIGSLFAYNLPQGELLLQELTGMLFEQGTYMRSAGVLGGLIAVYLEKTLSIYGALPVLIATLAFCFIKSFNGSFSSLFRKAQKRVTVKYDPTMYNNRRRFEDDDDYIEPVEVKTEPANRSAKASSKKRSKIETIDRASISQVDIPLSDDDDEELFLSDTRSKTTQPYSPPREKIKRQDAPVPVRAKKAPAPDAKMRRGEKSSRSAENAAKAAGVDVESLRNTVDEIMKPVPMSTEINDPPRKKKRINVDAEAGKFEAEINRSESTGDYQFPPLELLRAGDGNTVDAGDEVAANKMRLESAMDSFGIHAQIVDIIRGPTVTRYDIELPQGVKLARLTNLAGDLALSLGVINVRIAPIPDKISTVGIEVPNKIVSTVFLRDIIDSKNFSSAKSRLSFAIGKNISGDCVVGNISKLPHMLIAGTTGSGKSVCMNSLILSLLYKARPDEVKLIMIDPKMVELGVYNGIPHLYVPVVTDPKKAAGALQWSVVEMLKRYRLFSDIGVRDLDSYNRHCLKSGEEPMPRVVIVIDELADLMLVASKDVEESICRVAQMGRAAGMHLVIATQRPSADVITGLMKANIPSRIAFAVSSALESRIILDQAGAEKLVGMGDMLYSPVGCGKPMRIQGAFVSDEERESVIQFIKEGSSAAEHNEEIEQFMLKATEEKGGVSSDKGGKGAKDDSSAGAMDGYDEMLPQAVEVVIETKSCSVSMLQRRIKLGYSRAARIVDQMEELGVVGPYEGAKPRKVLVDRDGWHEIQVRHGFAAQDDLELAASISGESDAEFDDFDTFIQ